jgi:hypothetical protein
MRHTGFHSKAAHGSIAIETNLVDVLKMGAQAHADCRSGQQRDLRRVGYGASQAAYSGGLIAIEFVAGSAQRAGTNGRFERSYRASRHFRFGAHSAKRRAMRNTQRRPRSDCGRGSRLFPLGALRSVFN